MRLRGKIPPCYTGFHMSHARKVRIGFTVAASFGSVLLVGGVFVAGYAIGVRNPSEVIVKGITNMGDPDVAADFSVFWEAWKKLQEFHVDGGKVADTKLVYGAAAGMTNAYNDPNTVFFPPEDSKKFEEDIKGEFGGIGAEIGMKNDQLVIVAPLKESPAERAGLKSGDKILKVGDTATAGLSVPDAVKLIRGPIGTAVVLNVFRDEWVKPRDVRIVRQTIVIPTVDWNFKEAEGNFVHFQLYNFNQNALASFSRAAAEIAERNVRGMVLDVRNNPGGFLESAVAMAGYFLDRGEVVARERFRSGEEQVFKAQGNALFKSLPLVVLVNEGSASASEILAGALRVQRDDVKLVGAKTFGKGSVQELQRLHDGSQVKITIANWLLPDGELIEKKGLTPDVLVEMTEEDIKAERDPQLAKAFEVLKAQLAGGR